MRMLLLVGAESYCFQDPGGMGNRGRIDEDELAHKQTGVEETHSEQGWKAAH
jgi:hypothetical protein